MSSVTEPQSLIRENAERDPFKLLTDDHNRFRELLDAVDEQKDLCKKRDAVLQLLREIVSHASVEEQYLHELYLKHLPEEAGRAYFNDSLRADQSNIEALDALESKATSGSVGVVDLAALQKLKETEFEHMRLEEEVYFPALAEKLSAEQKVALYDSLVSAKRFAPTRAHTHRLDKPLGAKITHPIAGVLDRALDKLQGRS